MMADETTGLSNIKQVVWWVSEMFEVEEDFVGYMKWYGLELRSSTVLSLMCCSG